MYQCLPKYCNEILHSNPGSTAELEINPETNQFKRLFISFADSVMGFAYCRLVLDLDSDDSLSKSDDNSVLPLTTRRPTGRSKKQRIHDLDEMKK